MASTTKNALANALLGRATSRGTSTPQKQTTANTGLRLADKREATIDKAGRVGDDINSVEGIQDLLRRGELTPAEAQHYTAKVQAQLNQAAQGAAAGQNSYEQAALAAMSPEERAAYQTDKARNNQYGSDLSFLDPSFRMDPALLGQSAGSQVFADQGAIDAQRSLLGQQQALGSRDLQFMGGQQQQAMMDRLLGVQAPQFSGDADQRSVLNQALGFGSNTGPGSLAFDTSGRQGEQYGNLRDIIAGGGATAIEMANRQRQRADSEAWLRGQREADMANYAERGLTGSGMEMLALNTDRQGAAGRNSLADLETAKALEERRLGAINSAAGLATNMRGQTIDEQSLLAQRSTAGLNAAASVANSMRNANYNEQAFLNESARAQAVDAAGIAERMRGQTADEQIANRNAQQTALQQAGSLANQMRTSSFDEGASRANAADQFSILNNASTNAARNANTQFMQNAWQNMMNNRVQGVEADKTRQANAALGMYNQDVAQNTAGYNQGTQLGQNSANTFNQWLANYNNALSGASQGGNATALAGQVGLNNMYGPLGAFSGQFADSIISGATGSAGGGAAGGSTGAAAGGAAGASGFDWRKLFSSGGTQRQNYQPTNTGFAGGFGGY